MIVAGTNRIVHLHLPGPHTAEAEMIFKLEPDLVAPLLWRSEFRSALSLPVCQGLLTLAKAIAIAETAEFVALAVSPAFYLSRS